MKDILFKLLDQCETKQLAKIFETYMKSIGAKKYDGRRKDNLNTYVVDGKSANWNRVECYFHKESIKHSEENLLIVLRKEAGYYLIVMRKGKVAFERSYHSIVHYDEKLLNEIVKDHKPLFDILSSKHIEGGINMLHEKNLKFWRYRLEVKLNKMSDKEKVEFLANKLIKETGATRGKAIFIYTYNHCNDMTIDTENNEITCKYTGR